LVAAEAVCADDPASGSIARPEVFGLLQSLVDKSLVEVVETDGWRRRYRLLETIRHYAFMRLEQAGEFDGVMGRFLAYLTELAERAEPELTGADPGRWFALLEAEQDNFRSGLLWAHQQATIAAELRLVGALSTFWRLRGYHSEGAARISGMMAQTEDAAESEAAAEQLRDAGFLHWWLYSNYPKARALLAQALRIESDKGSVANWATLLNNLSGVAARLEEYPVARALIARSLSISVGKTNVDTAWSYTLLGDIALAQGAMAEAQAAYGQGAAVARTLEARNLLAYALRRQGQVALERDAAAEVAAFFCESLELNRQVDDPPGIASCLVALASVAARGGAVLDAVALLGHVDTLLTAAGTPLLAYDRQAFDRLRVLLHGQPSMTAYEAAWRQGRALTTEQAIAVATRPGGRSSGGTPY
jgi:tetratricopeptide (TPR) repeat protein